MDAPHLKVSHAVVLLVSCHQPWHADPLVLALKVSAGEPLVAAVGGLLAAPVNHTVAALFFHQWQPGGASAVGLVGSAHAFEVAVAALDLVIASNSMGTPFFLNG